MTQTACESVPRVAQRPRALAYADLTKPKQTALLMATGIGAYLMAATPHVPWTTFAVGMTAMFAAVSGSTVLNMVFDSDIDARMARTADRPLPSGEIGRTGAVVFGGALALGGVATALSLDVLFGVVITLGLVFDVVIYTMWLKRRTPLSILVGGISGGMPALAGRALSIGAIDTVGLLLAAGVVLWIPAHILTLASRHAAEYEEAGVPVWPSVYGEDRTRRVVAAATLGAVIVLLSAGVLAQVGPVAIAGLAGAGLAMLVLAVSAVVRPSERKNWTLFKAASAYMMFAFVCLTAGAVLGSGGF